MMKHSVIWGFVSTGLIAASVIAAGTAPITFSGATAASSVFASSNSPSQSQAEKTAIQHVGGGQISHISSDTYQGQAVYDIHVLYKGTLYDVKVSKSTGVVMQTKLSSEQPGVNGSSPSPSGSQPSSSSSSSVSSGQAGQLAVKAVGGGTVLHISSDHYQGTPVWDVHVQYQNQVWDVKISQITGSVAEKFLSPEENPGLSPSRSSQPTQDKSPDKQDQHNQKTQDQQDQHNQPSTPASPSSSGGIVYGQKLTTPPASYQQYVNQALKQENGTLKWIKLIQKHQGDIQANIKIRRAQGGTVKVKDLFSASGQLLQQTMNH